MNTHLRNGGFTRRRTFTIGPEQQKLPLPGVATQHQNGPVDAQKFQRTVSAPVFLRRAAEATDTAAADRSENVVSTSTPQHEKPPEPLQQHQHRPKNSEFNSGRSQSAASSSSLSSRSRRQETRAADSAIFQRRAVSAVVTPRDVDGGDGGNTHSLSPEPREPQEAARSERSLPYVSPSRPLFESSGTPGDNEVHNDSMAFANYVRDTQTGGVFVPSIASSIHSGALGVIDDISTFSPRWYPAWASSPPHQAPLNVTERIDLIAATPVGMASAATQESSVDPHSCFLTPLHTPEGMKKEQRLRDNLATFANTSTLHHSAVEGGSSLFPDTLGQTMPPNRNTDSNAKSSPSLRKLCVDLATATPGTPQVRICVEGCTGLPTAPFCVDEHVANGHAKAVSRPSSLSEPEPTATTADHRPLVSAVTTTTANEVYVYMRSNRSSRRYKSSSVPYAVTVEFPATQHDFLISREDGSDGAVLTFTVAVRLISTGKQVKLGICRLALCHLPDDRPLHLMMPIVAKAGTARARERGVLSLSVTTNGACISGSESEKAKDAAAAARIDEAVVRHRVLSVVRRACRERLDEVEVLVREHCRDAPAQLEDFLSQLEHRDAHDEHPPIASKRSAARSVTNREKRLPAEKSPADVIPTRASSSSSSSETAGERENGGSSPFTSFVLEERHGLRRSYSCTTPIAKTKPDGETAATRSEKDFVLASDGLQTTKAIPPPLNKKLFDIASSTSTRETLNQQHQRQEQSSVVPPLHLRSQSAPSVPRKSVAAAALRAAPPIGIAPKRGSASLITIQVHSVSGVRGEDGLPLTSCRNCFVRLSLLGGRDAIENDDGVNVTVVDDAGKRDEHHKDVLTEGTSYNCVDDRAVFTRNIPMLRLSSSSCNHQHLRHLTLRCCVFHGTHTLFEELGCCEVPLPRLLSAAADGKSRLESIGNPVEFVLVRHAGSPQAHVSGRIALSIAHNRRQNARHEAESRQTIDRCRTKPMQCAFDVLQKRVLSFLWHRSSCRAELHRLDVIAHDASEVGMEAAVSLCVSRVSHTGPSAMSTAVLRNTVSITIRSVALRGNAITGRAESNAGGNDVRPPFSRAAPSRVFMGWCCGCFGGRTKPVLASSCTDMLFSEPLPSLEDADPYRDELCLVVYSQPRLHRREDGTTETSELCRAHVSLRSFTTSPDGTAQRVRLPLVWRAGERGAFEQGYVSLSVLVSEAPASRTSATVFRTTTWRGFQANWPLRDTVADYLRCYATDQQHRLLPMLAEAEGHEERLLRRLRATYGPVGEPVLLRVCLVGFHPLQPIHGKSYLKLYRGDASLLRTPPIECSGTHENAPQRSLPFDCEGRKDVVPLLDEDKYLFYVSTTAPQQDTLLVKMGVEHLLRKNDVVAYAEVSVAAFVSLESRLAESMVAPSSGVGGGAAAAARVTPPPPPSPLWVLLCNDAKERVAEVAIRVEWVKATPLAPVRRVTTQRKSSIAAVARASSNGSNTSASSGEGSGDVRGVSRCAIPLLDTPTARDLFSLVQSYFPEELYRWSWYASRFGNAVTAHERLRRVLLSSHVTCTVYVDVAGISPRSATSLVRCGCRASDELSVTGFCLGSAAPCAAQCRVLSCEPARATVEAAGVIARVDADICPNIARNVLRLDLQLPTPTSCEEDGVLWLVVSAVQRAPSSSSSAAAAAPVTAAAMAKRAFSAPKRSRRSHSAEHFRQLRSRSTCGAPPTMSEGGRVSPQRCVSAFQLGHCPLLLGEGPDDGQGGGEGREVGRVGVSLRALLTFPELYRSKELISVPLVADASSISSSGRPCGTAVEVVGDVYLRVRMPAHESAPPWLRYRPEELERLRQGGCASRKDVRSQLQQRQLRLSCSSRFPAAEASQLHAAFFRSCFTAPPALVHGAAAETAYNEGRPLANEEMLGKKRGAKHALNARPPLPPPAASFGKAATTEGASNRGGGARFTQHDVYSLVDAADEHPSQLDDFSTPQRSKGERSLQEWTSEQGGVTAEKSSGVGSAKESVNPAAASERNGNAKRALLF